MALASVPFRAPLNTKVAMERFNQQKLIVLIFADDIGAKVDAQDSQMNLVRSRRRSKSEHNTFMALSLFAKLLIMERDSWKRELPVRATSEISWLTAIMI